MAGRALTRGIVLTLRSVARDAEAAIGHEASHRLRAMACVTRDVRVQRIPMGRLNVDARVTAGAVPPRDVVILVTRRAGLHGRGRVQRDGGGMAIGAADARVCRVREGDRPRVRRSIRNRHRDRLGTSRRELTTSVTRRAVTGRRRLMMTDLATAWWHECETRVGPARDVAGEAGELLMAIMGKGIDGSWEPGAGSRSRAWWVCVTLAFPFRFRVLDQRDTPQRARRVERLRWIDSAAAAGFHRRVAPGAVARVHLRSVREVTQRALLRYGRVRLARMERLVAPVSMASGGCAALQGVGRPGLLVRVVTHAARLAVRIARQIEVGELGPHFVAAKALVCPRTERAG